MATTRQLGTDEAFTASQQEAEAVLDDLLQLVRNLHAKHARYDDVDAARLDAFIGQMESVPPPTKCENAAIDKALLFDTDKVWNIIPGTINEPVSYVRERRPRPPTLTPHPPPLTDPLLRTRRYFHSLSASENAFGKAVATVDASAERVLAWLLCYESYSRKKKYRDEEGVRLRTGLDVPNSHSSMQVNTISFGIVADDRVFSAWWAWRREANRDLLAAMSLVEGELSNASAPLAPPTHSYCNAQTTLTGLKSAQHSRRPSWDTARLQRPCARS
jgi:hypothetical protein